MRSTVSVFTAISIHTEKPQNIIFYIYRSKCIKMLKRKVGTFQNYFKKLKLQTVHTVFIED